MILIGLGGNLDAAVGPPPQTFASALSTLERGGVRVVKRSSLYVSPPWPHGSGPLFFNQAICVETKLAPGILLQLLLKVEGLHGRTRRETWGPRTLDLDIIDYQGLVTDAEHLALPHPWTEDRAFVLKPISEIAPGWRHPISGLLACEALSAIDPAEAGSCRPFIPA